MKKSVIVRAPLLTRSGYGVHARQVFKYLLSRPDLEVYTHLVPWGCTPWNIDENSENGLIQEAIKRSVSNFDRKFDFSVQVQLPNEWDTSLASKNIGITAAVETDKANPTWNSVHCSKMDMVIVPSEHAKRSLTNSSNGSAEIKVVPESYFSEIDEEISPLNLELATDFNFLVVGVFTGISPENDRKNLFYTIKWITEEFKDDENVGLILKTSRGRETTIDRKLIYKTINQVCKETKSGINPRVYLLHGAMSREEMAGLYKNDKIKALVSCSRGEGFGLPLLEASASGLPVIATDWSAHTEFLNLGKWIKLDYELKTIADSRVDQEIFMPGSKWAEVKEDDFKRKLRKFYLSSQKPKEWASKLSPLIKEDYSWTAIAKKYDEAFSGVLF